jgi:hypothetical protein
MVLIKKKMTGQIPRPLRNRTGLTALAKISHTVLCPLKDLNYARIIKAGAFHASSMRQVRHKDNSMGHLSEIYLI